MGNSGFRAGGAVVVSVALAALALAGCGSSARPSAAPSSGTSSAQRIATDSNIAMDDLIVVGMTPACAAGDAPGNDGFGPLLTPYSSKVVSLGPSVAGSDFNVEALAKCAPNVILAPSYDEDTGKGSYYGTAAKTEKSIAKTYFFAQPNPPVVNGVLQSTWRNWFLAAIDPLGGKARADEVIAKMDLRAAAIRGQVSGKTLAVVSLDSASAWEAVNDYLPLATVYIQDLGLKNFTLPAGDYAKGCLDAANPQPCYTNSLSEEVLPKLSGADAILLQSELTSSGDQNTFESDPLFESLPEAKTGHIAMAQAFTDVGPIGVAYEYSQIVEAFKLSEYHATTSGATASVTLDAATGKVCWAVDPAPGKGQPSGPVTLKAGSTTLTLASSPAYTTPDAAYQTSPATQQASGCATAPAALAQALAQSPSSVTLTAAGGQGALAAGPGSLIVS
jgi:ABC-type Fe3+-hydroxamate transport system substrate-binding protein